MGKRKAGQQNSDQPANGEVAPESVESPNLVPPQGDTAPSDTVAQIGGDEPAAEPEQQTVLPPDASAAPAIKPEPRQLITVLHNEIPHEDAAPESGRSESLRRFVMPLAATIAIVTCLGVAGGALATAGLGHLFTAGTTQDDNRALRDSVARLEGELIALKSSLQGSNKTASGQVAKLGERIEKMEKAQAEPAAKLAKIGEAVERLERRAPETTGSIAAPSGTPQAAVSPLRLPVVSGWVLRDVVNGAALVEGRVGVLEIAPGDALPGLGRVEAIRRQDGRWVVVTAKGLIVAR